MPGCVLRRSGGDMVALGYILICLVTTVAIVAISVIAIVAGWWTRRKVVPNA